MLVVRDGDARQAIYRFRGACRPHDQIAEVHGLVVGLRAFVAFVDGSDFKALLGGDLLRFVVTCVFTHFLRKREITLIIIQLVR
jgi:hypothetical protein